LFEFEGLELERVRPVGADRELELEQKFVRDPVVAVAGAAELSTDLAELARPVSKDKRSTGS
jgi:hypothetical protein